ncbi:flagellar hook protein FlgE, partial [Oxalobacteraceae bacterium OM1]
GFKQSQAQFSDVFAASITGAGGSPIGIGTQLAQVAQQFTQGNITTTNNPLDIAINGDGFFRMSTGGTVTYGRNGQFQLDKDGFIVNATGAHLTGYSVDQTGNLVTGAPQDLVLNTSALAPLQTANVNTELNLNAKAALPVNTPFNANDPTTYNNASSVTVFDSLGVSHVMQLYYVKNATPGQWDVYATCDSQPLATPQLGSLHFKSDGTIDTTATTLPFSGSIDIATLDPTSIATSPLVIDFDFKGSTQSGGQFQVTKLSQDGYTSGELSGFVIGNDGIITGRYTNGKSAPLGQIILAKFQNPNGLQPLGNNVWAESASSGQPLIGSPGGGGLGVLKSSAVEDSNVDLTAELVNMITAQRVYQANAQTIKTQDQVLQTLVNLR